MPATPRPPATNAGAETRARLIEAALETLTAEGVSGTSSRAVARRAGCNQALIFYHFGSFEGLVAEAARRDSELRAERFADRLADVTSLPQLVAVGRELHGLEVERGSIRSLSQLLAMAGTSPALRTELAAAFRPWVELVESALARSLARSPLGPLVDIHLGALGIASLFVGIELVAGLDDETGPERLLGFLADLATVGAALVPAALPGPAAVSPPAEAEPDRAPDGISSPEA